MPNNRLLVRPDLVVVDSSKEPEEKEVICVYQSRYSFVMIFWLKYQLRAYFTKIQCCFENLVSGGQAGPFW